MKIPYRDVSAVLAARPRTLCNSSGLPKWWLGWGWSQTWKKEIKTLFLRIKTTRDNEADLLPVPVCQTVSAASRFCKGKPYYTWFSLKWASPCPYRTPPLFSTLLDRHPSRRVQQQSHCITPNACRRIRVKIMSNISSWRISKNLKYLCSRKRKSWKPAHPMTPLSGIWWSPRCAVSLRRHALRISFCIF